MDVISRAQAIEAGLKHYYTGRPCPEGHDCRRFVSNYGCELCLLENSRAYQKSHPEYFAEHNATYHRRDPDGNARRSRLSYARCREKRTAYQMEWQKRNPDKVTEYAHRRRAAKAASSGSVSAQEWRAVVDACGNKCLRCGAEGVSMDHVVPLSRGGSHSIDNIQPLRRRCNSSKGTKTIDYRSK